MVAIYIAAFLVGIVILIFGIVAGNLDHSIETHDQVEGDGDTWIPFLSPRFWIYGLGSFGLAGILGTLARLDGTLIIASIAGLATGLIVSYLVRFLFRKAETTGEYKFESLLGHVGSVTVPIRAESKGKIRLNRHNEVLEVLAKSSKPQEEIMPGVPVIVVGVEGDTLEVIRQDEVLTSEP